MLVTEVAEKLGTSTQWVRRLIKNGDLVAIRWGNQWLVSETSLAIYQSKKVAK